MIIRPIEKDDVGGAFCCGRPALDTFFEKRAWSHAQSYIARVYVLVDDASGSGPPTVFGFYTLSAKQIERERVRGPLPGSLPKYPLPVFYIGYIAVAESYQRGGLGRRLMADALRRCGEGVKSIGAVGVFLDSLDEKSTAFYRKLGFVELPHSDSDGPDSPQAMFLPMKDLLAALSGGQ